MGTPRAAPSAERRCLSGDAPDQTDGECPSAPPFWHDGTARPIHRPIAPEDQPESYRGQKKCHTITNLLIIDETCPICFLSATGEGQEPDQSLADLAGYTLPCGSHLYQERGFQGYTGDGITIVPPKKNPPGGERTPLEKATNRAISSIRIRIEHAIGSVKRDRRVKDKIRLFKDGLRDSMMEACGGLHNFRLQYRPWNYAN